MSSYSERNTTLLTGGVISISLPAASLTVNAQAGDRAVTAHKENGHLQENNNLYHQNFAVTPPKNCRPGAW